MIPSRTKRASLVMAACALFSPSVVSADETSATVTMTLDDAERLAKTRGFDALVADAQLASARGDVRVARTITNPSVTFGYGHVFESPPGGSQSWYAGLSDQGAIVDALSGKRLTRSRAAEAALAAAKTGRKDAERVLAANAKQRYVQVVASHASLDLANENAATATRMLELNRARYPAVIDEGQLARIETAKLEADQAVVLAEQALRAAEIELAFATGAAAPAAHYAVDDGVLGFRVPAALKDASETSLVHAALEHRPDLEAARHRNERADANAEVARRDRFPTIAFWANYMQTGTGPTSVQPPTLTFGITTPLPILDQNQGPIALADADVRTQLVEQRRLAARIAADVAGAYAEWVAARQIVERTESTLLARARRAKEITETQFQSGAGTLLDYLDAQRTFIAVRRTHLQVLAGYWSAVFTLEQAVGTELRK